MTWTGLARGGVAGASAAAALASCGTANAQVPGLDERRVEFTVQGSAVYDSNVARGNDTVVEARRLKKGEFTYNPSARVDVALPLGQQSVFLNGDVGYEFRQYNSELENRRISLTGGGQRRVGPCMASVTGGYSSNQSDLSDLSLGVTRNTQDGYSVSGGLSCMPLAGLGASVGVQYSETANSADLGVVNSTAKGVNAGLNYSNRLLGTLSLVATYSTSSYSDPGVEEQFVPPRFETYGVSLNLIRPIGTRLTGSATVGYTRLRSKGRDAGGFDGLTGSGSLNYRINPRMTAALSYRRGVSSSLLQGADYSFNESLSLSANYRLGARLSTSFGGSVTRSRQRGEIAPSIVAVSRDDSKSLFAGFSVPIGRQSNISFNGSYETRNAKPTLFNYDAYRIGVTASTTF